MARQNPANKLVTFVMVALSASIVTGAITVPLYASTPSPVPSCTPCYEQEIECVQIRPVGEPQRVMRCVEYDNIPPAHCAYVMRQNYECVKEHPEIPLQAITECDTGTPINNRPCTLPAETTTQSTSVCTAH